jgi:hypothetical protein
VSIRSPFLCRLGDRNFQIFTWNPRKLAPNALNAIDVLNPPLGEGLRAARHVNLSPGCATGAFCLSALQWPIELKFFRSVSDRHPPLVSYSPDWRPAIAATHPLRRA